MTDETIACTLIGWVSVGVLLYIWRSLYPATRIEQFRQTMFDLRAKLFDDAADGKLGFDEKPYHVLRTTMNGLIKDADALTLFEVVVLTVTVKEHKEDLETLNAFKDALGTVDGQRQKLYLAHQQAMQRETMVFLFKRYMLLQFAMLLAAHISNLKDWLLKQVAPFGRKAEIHAYKVGRMQLS